jgi:hypothetical protein
MRRLRSAVVLGALVAFVFAAPAFADVKITDQDAGYVRHDGGTDATIADCSSDATTPGPGGDGSGERQANEPTATVAPNNSNHMTAGANDYCPLQTTTDAWAGFYYSSNGGTAWTNSLLPGYPTDTSAEGQASPLFGLVAAAGDPVQAWDNAGRLYYAGIAFNRDKPSNGSIWVARYNWPTVATAPDYEFTTIVSRGTPTPFFAGIFEDKVQLEVDKGASSPHSGNVYICWTRFTPSGSNNFVELATSTDGGRTFRTQKISDEVHGNQFCDIAVTSNGTVFVGWRQFEFNLQSQQAQRDAVVWVKSTNGGVSFTKPAVAREFIHWDLTDHFGSPELAGQARYESCLAADYTLGGCAGPEPAFHARDCGDGPFVCSSGYVFHRSASQVRITADPTTAGNPNAAYVVYDASVPGSQTPTGTSYGTIEAGTGSQASIYFIKTTNGGASWSTPARIAPQAKGHQFFPDIDANNGKLYAVWQDSRNDCSAGPPSTPSGGDFRTVPFSNRWVSSNPPGAVNCEPGGPGSDTGGLVTLYAKSANGGGSWSKTIVSSALTMPQYEQFGNRDIPFFGDYNYIDASGSKVLMNWTDEREAVTGTDPRYTNGDGTDGFDVIQCRLQSADGSWSADNCPNAGGLDQNIFGFVATG